MMKSVYLVFILILLMKHSNAVSLRKPSEVSSIKRYLSAYQDDSSEPDINSDEDNNALMVYSNYLSHKRMKEIEKRFPKWRTYASVNSDPYENWDTLSSGAYNHESRKAWQRNMDEKRKLYRKIYG